MLAADGLTFDSIRAAMKEGADTVDIAKRYGLREADIWNALGGRPPPPPPKPRKPSIPSRPEYVPSPAGIELADKIAADRVVLALRRPDGMTAGFIAGEYRAHLGRASEAIVILAKRGFGRIERRAGNVAWLVPYGPTEARA